MDKTRFICQNCGYVSFKWQGRCPACGKWDSFQEEIVRKDKILKEVQDFVMRAKDKQTVQNSRETLFRQNNTSRAPIETPIDRNGVSPADVQLEKIFYTGR